MDQSDMPGEVWGQLPGHENVYDISTQARARSLDRKIVRSDGIVQNRRGRMMRVSSHEAGYPVVNLWSGGSARVRYMHELVLLTFVGPRPPGMLIRHLNGDPRDSRLENLAYGTPSENQLDQVLHGTHYLASKSHCPLEHALVPPNLIESRLPYRICLACNRGRATVRSRHAAGLPSISVKQAADEKYTLIMAGLAPQKRRRVS